MTRERVLRLLRWLVGVEPPGSCCPYHAARERHHIPRRGWG